MIALLDDSSTLCSDAYIAEMPAGAVVLYKGSVIHAGGTNSTTDRSRAAIHLSFVAGWPRTAEANQLSTPPDDEARHLPRGAQELLGYKAHDAIEMAGGYLGVVELQHPTDLLAKGEL